MREFQSKLNWSWIIQIQTISNEFYNEVANLYVTSIVYKNERGNSIYEIDYI